MLSTRIQNLTPSVTVELNNRVTELQRNGVDIIKLNVGEPDFNTPDHIGQAAFRAIENGYTKYTPVNGIYDLRKAICHKFERDNQIDYNPDQIVVTTGAKQALLLAVFSICNPGDEIIIPTPCWGSFIEIVKLAEGIPVLVAAKEENDFEIDIKSIADAITPKTKAIIINTPNNPTGAVYSSDVLKLLGELAVQNSFIIISDEIYDKLVYDDTRHVSIAGINDAIYENTILVNGVSKSYAMPGWRLGYAAAGSEIIKGMCDLQGHMTTTTNSISQYAALTAISSSQECLERMRQEYNSRRKFLFGRLNNMPNISCSKNKGAFYILVNIAALYGKRYDGKIIHNSKDVTEFFLNEAHVAVVQGDAFHAPEHIRISYSNSLQALERAADQIEAALERLC